MALRLDRRGAVRELNRVRGGPAYGAAGGDLWSISAANNLTTRTVAVLNGLPETAN